MSGIPPQLNAETGTPATEWAAKTTSALEPTSPATGLNPTTHQLFEQKHMNTHTNPTAQEPLQNKVLHDPLAQASAASTPGQELPGAFPRETAGVGTDVDELQAKAAKLAESVSNTASSLLPAAAQYLPQSVVDTVSPYLPASLMQDKDTAVASAHDHPHHISMPSSELNGAGEHEFSEGVGALPGRVDESDVTELPGQENASTFQTASSVVPLTTAVTAKGSLPSQEPTGAQPFEHSSGVGALPGSVTSSGVAVLPDEHARGATNATNPPVGTHSLGTSLPSQEPTGVKPFEHSSGAGALPGHSSEAGVAVLPRPDERGGMGMGKWETESGAAGAPQTKGSKVGESEAMAERARDAGARKYDEMHGRGAESADGAGSGAAPVGSAAGAAAIGAAVGEKEMQKHEEKDAQKEERKEEKKEKGDHAKQHGKPNQGGGYDTDYHPAQMHPPDQAHDQAHADAEKEKEPAAEKDGEGPTHKDKSRDSSESRSRSQNQDNDKDNNKEHAQKTKKAGFMAKMKGEAKVLLGKVEGKPHKVEEGQRMKQGEVGQAAH